MARSPLIVAAAVATLMAGGSVLLAQTFGDSAGAGMPALTRSFADSLDTAPADLGFGGGYFTLLLRTLLYLVAISLLIYVALKWVFPRVFRWNFPGSSSMAVIDRLPMGAHKSVCVVRAAGRYYLVGVTDAQIQLLTELDPQEVEANYPDKAKRPGRD
ncbi:MAG: flagellar biosynthetic protein FliO [Candidatus Eisenbacteria bacterium]